MQTKGYSRNVEGFMNLWSEFHEKALNIWDEELAAIGETEKQPVLIWSSELTQAHRIQKHLDKKRYCLEYQRAEPILGSMQFLNCTNIC